MSTANKTIRRKRCKSAASSLGTECAESDDDGRSIMTELDMTSPIHEDDLNVYDEGMRDEIKMIANVLESN
jgi:hypothetical protein